MTDASFTAALAALTETQIAFLAGMIYARGKLYVGTSTRDSGATRYSPTLQVEMSQPIERSELTAVLGEPTERRYYGAPTYRYAVQDRDRIAAILTAIYPQVSPLVRPQVDDMLAFCSGDEKARSRAVEHLRTR